MSSEEKQSANPFLNPSLAPNIFVRLRIILFRLTLIPYLKGLLFFLILLINSTICYLILLTHKQKNENGKRLMLRGIRYSIANFSQIIAARIGLFCLGYFYINVKKHKNQQENDDHNVIYVANHSSHLDVLILIATSWKSFNFVSKAELAKVPLLSSTLIATNTLFIDRDSNISKDQLMDDLKEKINEPPGSGQIFIFPEGTMSYSCCVTTFKIGAFKLGVPIIPVVIKYKGYFFNPSFVPTESSLSIFMGILDQFFSTVEIEYLDCYIPNESEKKDAHLFADNVRKLFLNTIPNSVDSKNSYEDVQFLRKVKNRKMKKYAAKYIILKNDIYNSRKLLDLRIVDYYNLVSKFIHLDIELLGRVSYSNLISNFPIFKKSKYSRRLFEEISKGKSEMTFGDLIEFITPIFGSKHNGNRYLFTIIDFKNDGNIFNGIRELNKQCHFSSPDKTIEDETLKMLFNKKMTEIDLEEIFITNSKIKEMICEGAKKFIFSCSSTNNLYKKDFQQRKASVVVPYGASFG